MASEATKMAVIDNMHKHVRVFEVTEFNSEVRSDLQGYTIVSRSSLGPLPSCYTTHPCRFEYKAGYIPNKTKLFPSKQTYLM